MDSSIKHWRSSYSRLHNSMGPRNKHLYPSSSRYYFLDLYLGWSLCWCNL
jgi:hypothetical protein